MDNKKDNYLQHLDFYETDKQDVLSYIFRLKEREQMKLTPQENLEVYMDLGTKEWTYGIETTEIMGMPARRYFIFEFLDEKLLGPHRKIQKIMLPEDEFKQFLTTLTEKKTND